MIYSEYYAIVLCATTFISKRNAVFFGAWHSVWPWSHSLFCLCDDVHVFPIRIHIDTQACCLYRKYFECRYKERAGSRVHVDHCIDRYTRLWLHFRPSIADYGRHYGGQDRARVDIRNDRAALPVFYLRPMSDNQTVPQMAMGSQEILHASAARSATAVSGR